MPLTQVKTSRTSVECTSTQITGTAQVKADLKTSLYDQLLDGLSRLKCTEPEVQIVMGLLQELGRAVHMDDHAFVDKRGIFCIQMDMAGHCLLDEVMADKAVAADGSLHELANKVFLPAGKTFVHDATDFCVIEVRNA